MEHDKDEEHTNIPDRVFVAVWITLLLLTGITVETARIQLGGWSMLVNILIASSKASLVLWFFMHLKYEKRLFKLMLFVPIVTLTVIIGLTFFDIWYR